MQLVHENYNFAILKKHKNTFILFSENQVENVDKIMFIFSVFRLDIWIVYGKLIFFYNALFQKLAYLHLGSVRL